MASCSSGLVIRDIFPPNPPTCGSASILSVLSLQLSYPCPTQGYPLHQMPPLCHCHPIKHILCYSFLHGGREYCQSWTTACCRCSPKAYLWGQADVLLPGKCFTALISGACEASQIGSFAWLYLAAISHEHSLLVMDGMHSLPACSGTPTVGFNSVPPLSFLPLLILFCLFIPRLNHSLLVLCPALWLRGMGALKGTQ